MSLMDGDEVLPGDTVWDKVLDETGTVQNVYSDKFSVKFGKRKRTYTYEGVRDGATHRSLFWARNDYFIPRKNPEHRSHQRRLILQVIKTMDDYARVVEPTISLDKSRVE